MVLADMRQLLALNHIRKGLVRRERQSNGWLVALEDFDGGAIHPDLPQWPGTQL